MYLQTSQTALFLYRIDLITFLLCNRNNYRSEKFFDGIQSLLISNIAFRLLAEGVTYYSVSLDVWRPLCNFVRSGGHKRLILVLKFNIPLLIKSC
jgi:hypothetical protein